MISVIGFLLVAFVVRLGSLWVSVRNEKRLKSAGAVEHGRGVSLLLGSLHAVYYLACLGEAYRRGTEPDALGFFGMGLWVFSMAALAVVVKQLGAFWTVKLIIAKDHQLVTSPLFRAVRHPNYFLNVIPELVAISLVAHAWIPMAFLLPGYLAVLAARISLEEKVMRRQFADYP